MSTAVNFYLLPSNDDVSLLGFAAYMSVKFWRASLHPHIHCESESQHEQFTQALEALSLPTLMPLAKGQQSVVYGATIGWHEDHVPIAGNDVIINLSNNVIKAFSRFEKLIEITDKNESRIAAKRELYRFYKDRHYPLQTHTIEWRQLSNVLPQQINDTI